MTDETANRSASSSPTPRTDDLLKTMEHSHYTVFDALPHLQEHARQLERELFAAKQAETEQRNLASSYLAERDELLSKPSSIGAPSVQDVMWEVFEYGDRSHAFQIVKDKPECSERTEAREALLEQGNKIRALLSNRSTVAAPAATPGAYNWINEAVRVLKAFDNSAKGREESLRSRGYWGEADSLKGLIDATDELLSGVPVPPQDLGFDSPADKYARAWHALNENRSASGERKDG